MADQKVVLTVPAHPEFLRVIRMTASGLGSRLGFTIDEVDDLRLALDELCFALIGKGIETDLTVTYLLQPNALVINGTTDHPAPKTGLNDLSQQILPALVDHHELIDDGTRSTFTLTKRQTATSHPIS